MAQGNCLVFPLLEVCTKDELCSVDGAMHTIFLKTITRCKCPDHIAENPIELPTINELNIQLAATIGELLDWGCDHMKEDSSGNSRALIGFIEKNCLAPTPDALFSIVDNLVKLYPTHQNLS
jgi:hypothetical protein